MKRTIALFGLLGLVGCFLPLIPGVSLFDLRHFGEGWHAWLVIAAFAIPAYAGATASDAAAGLAGLAGFGYLGYKFGTGVYDLVVHASLGGMMMGVAVIGGILASLGALAAPQRR
jgi:hypothetical protein